jgi:L-ascorbate 6-phosphate lactonase
MNSFQLKVEQLRLNKHQVAIFWLGQAGFVIKTQDQKLIVIDPYLSDCCERLFGFQRLTYKLINPQDINADLILFSHDHQDHCDIDSIPFFAANQNTEFAGSPTAINICKQLNISPLRLHALSVGDRIELDEIEIEATFADHGDSVPDAIGFLIEVDGLKIYFAGDTSLRLDQLSRVIEYKPDLVILPINGAYGNLDPVGAAQLTSHVGARFVIPCHYWTFREHCENLSDPMQFEKEAAKWAPDTKTVFLAQGGVFVLQSAEETQ